MVKVAATAETRGEVLDVVQLFRAKVIDVAPDAVTVQIIGNAGKIADFLAVVEPFGIRELVQSGQVAIGRGSRSISERSLRPVAVPVPPSPLDLAGGRAGRAQRARVETPAPRTQRSPTRRRSPPWPRCSTTTTPTCP